MSKAETSPFDFDELDLGAKTDKPVEFELVHPETKEGLGVFLSVIGSESDTFQKYLRVEADRERRRAFENSRKGKVEEPRTSEQEEQTVLSALAACLTGWRTVIDGSSEPVIYWSGRKIQFSPDNAVKWMQKFRWVRPQINQATGDLSRFLDGSPTTSSPSPAATSS